MVYTRGLLGHVSPEFMKLSERFPGAELAYFLQEEGGRIRVHDYQSGELRVCEEIDNKLKEFLPDFYKNLKQFLTAKNEHKVKEFTKEYGNFFIGRVIPSTRNWKTSSTLLLDDQLLINLSGQRVKELTDLSPAHQKMRLRSFYEGMNLLLCDEPGNFCYRKFAPIIIPQKGAKSLYVFNLKKCSGIISTNDREPLNQYILHLRDRIVDEKAKKGFLDKYGL
ncbi:MAG: hypothetical protein ACI9GW_000554 [Halieaceae bacterium]|jgi:hypothetical protein